MKLWEKYVNAHRLKRALKRATRGRPKSTTKNSPAYMTRSGKRKKNAHKEKIIAPNIIDLYTTKYHDRTILFVSEIEKKAREIGISTRRKVHICFRNTTTITAAAGLWLLARIESIKVMFPHVKYIVSKPLPVKVGNSHDKKPVVDSVLNRIGFYEAIGIKTRNMQEIANVKCWEVLRGEAVMSSAVGQLLESVTDKLNIDYSGLYRPLIEAMANSVEHAYRSDLYRKTKLSNTNKWWCFAALLENRLTVLICDLGVGIPNTLKKTQPSNIMLRLIEYIGKNLSSDSDYIRASLQVKKTRTKLDYRGKGGTDLQSIIENVEGSRLSIMSNKGNYRFTNKDNKKKPELCWDGNQSISGTVVEWSISLPLSGTQ
ncbi:TPA: hypothetical protein OOF66_003998 [Morganella morganii]|uniref:hypothetical protein n=1 Tax=Morganella morganii TaxID=582 RepID=UPI00132F75D1|nr:hypothetical protein [Morganella morganii]HCR4037704.1 hypothetical protein [Morganella morganii]HCR4051885.1 hypothetical protein [Morganella morganii]